MRLRVELPIEGRQLDILVGIAIHHGYARVEPRKSWKLLEKKEAARYAMERLISLGIKKGMENSQ